VTLRNFASRIQAALQLPVSQCKSQLIKVPEELHFMTEVSSDTGQTSRDRFPRAEDTNFLNFTGFSGASTVKTSGQYQPIPWSPYCGTFNDCHNNTHTHTHVIKRTVTGNNLEHSVTGALWANQAGWNQTSACNLARRYESGALRIHVRAGGRG
jgi:hypothetical protein